MWEKLAFKSGGGSEEETGRKRQREKRTEEMNSVGMDGERQRARKEGQEDFLSLFLSFLPLAYFFFLSLSFSLRLYNSFLTIFSSSDFSSLPLAHWLFLLSSILQSILPSLLLSPPFFNLFFHPSFPPSTSSLAPFVPHASSRGNMALSLVKGLISTDGPSQRPWRWWWRVTAEHWWVLFGPARLMLPSLRDRSSPILLPFYPRDIDFPEVLFRDGGWRGAGYSLSFDCSWFFWRPSKWSSCLIVGVMGCISGVFLYM